MELALPIAEVLAQPIPIPQQFAQLLGGRVGQPTGRRPLLGGEPRDAQGINGVGLRPLEFFRGKAPRPQGIQQGHRESLGHQYGEYILPVMAGRLHGHQGLWRRPQQREQVLVAPSILGEAGGFEHYRLRRIHTRHAMPLRAHIDPRIASQSLPTGGSGSLAAGPPAHACLREDARGASGYRSSVEHRARAPI